MKKHLQRILFVCLFALVGTTAFAQQVEIDSIYYNLDDSTLTASVTYGNEKYSGAVHIPEEIVFYGTTYSVTSIGWAAFNYCSGLTEVAIPNSVTSIDDSAFSDCRGLTKLTIPDGVTSIGNGAFDGCSGLTELTIGNSVTTIGDNAFRGCSGLTEVIIPDSVTSIGGWAFYNSRSLIKLTIGSSVTSIGREAFPYCYNLISVTSLNPTPPAIFPDTFASSHDATLHVPAGCKEAYQAGFWGFLNILEDAVDGIAPVVAGQQPTTDAIYTLDGVKLNATSLQDLPSGIYIVNGKKYVVK